MRPASRQGRARIYRFQPRLALDEHPCDGEQRERDRCFRRDEPAVQAPVTSDVSRAWTGESVPEIGAENPACRGEAHQQRHDPGDRQGEQQRRSIETHFVDSGHSLGRHPANEVGAQQRDRHRRDRPRGHQDEHLARAVPIRRPRPPPARSAPRPRRSARPSAPARDSQRSAASSRSNPTPVIRRSSVGRAARTTSSCIGRSSTVHPEFVLRKIPLEPRRQRDHFALRPVERGAVGEPAGGSEVVGAAL